MTKKSEKSVTLGKSKASEKTTTLHYQVFRDGDEVDDVDISTLPTTMNNPDRCWEHISKFCKDNDVNIHCHLSRRYKLATEVVFRSSGKYVFFLKHLSEKAHFFTTSSFVYEFTVNYHGRRSKLYCLGSEKDDTYILSNCDDADIKDYVAIYSETFGDITLELIASTVCQFGTEI